MRRRSDLAAYVAMRAALAVLKRLPRRPALAAGAAAGRAAWRLGMRRAVTRENLRLAFPELGRAEREALGRLVYRHFGRMAVDSLRLSASGPSALVPYVAGAEAVTQVREALAKGRGVILLTGHIGNWELGGAFLAASGIPLAGVVKPPSNPYIARDTERVRRALGIETVDMPEATAVIPEMLRANRAVALVADQGAHRSSIWSPFFGRPTKTPFGPGLFAVRSGAPVIFGAMVAEPDRTYRLQTELLFEELTGDVTAAAQRVADRFRDRLEASVRRYPDQYLWSHRLWRHAPPAPPATPPLPPLSVAR